MGRMEGKAVLVTGGAQGMGRSHSMLLASEGARVAVTDIDEAAGQAVVDEIKAAGGDGLFFNHNVADAGDPSRFDGRLINVFRWRVASSQIAHKL